MTGCFCNIKGESPAQRLGEDARKGAVMQQTTRLTVVLVPVSNVMIYRNGFSGHVFADRHSEKRNTRYDASELRKADSDW